MTFTRAPSASHSLEAILGARAPRAPPGGEPERNHGLQRRTKEQRNEEASLLRGPRRRTGPGGTC